MGNHKPIKKQVAIQKPLKESNETMASHCNNSLDGSYISKNDVNEVKGPILVAESYSQNAKWLVVVDFTEKCIEYFRELFYNVGIENREITEPLIAEYNLKVKNLLLEIQADYRFRLRYCDISYDEVVVWTGPAENSCKKFNTTGTSNPSPNFQSQPCPNNSFLDRSHHTRQGGKGGDTLVAGGQPVEQKESTPLHTVRQTSSMW